MKALVFHGAGDLRLEDVPKPEPLDDGDVLVEIEIALTDGTDTKAFARGHPVLLGPLPSRFGHGSAGSRSRPGSASLPQTPRRA